MKKDMRRNEKAISRDECVQVLDTAEYGVLSTVSTDGTPYGLSLIHIFLAMVPMISSASNPSSSSCFTFMAASMSLRRGICIASSGGIFFRPALY